MYSYAHAVQTNVESKRFVSKVLENSQPNSQKMQSVTTNMNDPNVISSSSVKAKLFPLNYTLDDKDRPFPDFLPFMEHNKVMFLKS